MIGGLARKLIPVLTAVSITTPVFAVDLVPANVAPSGKTVVVSQVAIDQSSALEVLTIVHYKKGFNHKPQHNSGGGEPIGSTCYGFISKGAEFTAVENLVYNHANSGLPQNQVESAFAVSSSEWDNHTATNLFGTLSYNASANFDSAADGVNELSFGNYSTSGVIAVTRIWGIFYGPPSGRYIDQFDIQFDTDYVWGDAAVEATLMDLQNIAVHEIGHGIGLADIYDGACTTVTMYGYSTERETSKRTIESADITGLQTLYGI